MQFGHQSIHDVKSCQEVLVLKTWNMEYPLGIKALIS
jgi:hypothetical protein